MKEKEKLIELTNKIAVIAESIRMSDQINAKRGKLTIAFEQENTPAFKLPINVFSTIVFEAIRSCEIAIMAENADDLPYFMLVKGIAENLYFVLKHEIEEPTAEK